MRSTFSLLTLILLSITSVFSHSIDQGSTLDGDEYNLMQFVNSSIGWVVGINGMILKTTDGGAHWLGQSSGVSNELFCLSFVDTARGWVSGQGGVILSTTNGGKTWKQQQSGTQRLCKAMRFIDALHGWVVCDSGVIVATTNGGASWTNQPTQTIASLCSVVFTSTQKGWACGSNGALVKTTNGGATWTTTIVDTTLNFWGMAFGDAMHGCIVGSDLGYDYGNSFTTTDGGETWTAGQENVSPLFTVQLFTNNSGWATGRSGTVLKTSDGGNSWTSANTPIPYWLSLSSFVDMNTGWVSDPTGHFMKTTYGEGDWSPQSPLLKHVNLPSASFADAITGRAFFEKSDKNLNDVYQRLLLAKRHDTIFIKNLRASERIWIKFRDAQLTLKYPKHVSVEKRDPLPMNQAMYLAHLTEDRTKMLLELLKTPTNGVAAHHTLHDNVYDESRNGYNRMKIYVSDLKIIRSGNVHGGMGIDRPYWRDDLVICGKKYRKGIVMHPENGGIIAYAEFLLPKKGGHLLGIAGWAEEEGAIHQGKMRYRIFIDGELLCGNELSGKESRKVDLDLGLGKVLRIETDDGLDGNEADHMAFGDLSIIY